MTKGMFVLLQASIFSAAFLAAFSLPPLSQLPIAASPKPLQCVNGTWVRNVPSDVTDPIVLETKHFIIAFNGSQDFVANELTVFSNYLEELFEFFTTTAEFPPPFCLQTTKYKTLAWVSSNFGLNGGGTSVPGMGGIYVNSNSVGDKWGMVRIPTLVIKEL
jgi:hypothetical protein